jgi:hypothetical protein
MPELSTQTQAVQNPKSGKGTGKAPIDGKVPEPWDLSRPHPPACAGR